VTERVCKFRARQRISTLHGRPVHLDAQEAFDSLTQPRIDALRAAVHTGTAVEDAIALRREMAMEIDDEGDEDDEEVSGASLYAFLYSITLDVCH